jgi:hypothetical protein
MVNRVLISSLVFCAAAAQALGPSRVIVPDQRIPLLFSHVQHLTKAGVTCTFCHNKVTKSMKAEDRNIPGHPECDECHNRTAKEPLKERPPAACQTCHADYSPVRKDMAFMADMPTAFIKFPHKTHTDRKIACTTCHGDFVKQGVILATRAQLPTMTLCLSCHDNKQAKSACKTCHHLERGGTMVTNLPTGVLKPAGIFRNDRHDGTWLQDHRTRSEDKAYCMNCHTDQYCQDCHNGVMKPFKFHPGDFVSSHSIAAKANSLSCDGCHRDQSFCLACHQRLGASHVSSTAATGVVGSPRSLPGQRFHPLGWVTGPQASLNHHGFQAQRNIRQCSACHSERTCTDSCHRTGSLKDLRGMPGQGISPHGPDFSTRCSALFARNRRVCLKCHVSADPKLLQCR